MKIKILKDKCVSARSCLIFAEKTFGLDNNGKVMILDKNGNSEKEILQAAESCPVNAIELFDDSGKKIYPK